MARYIDADALIRLIEIDAVCNSGNFSKRDVILSVKASPTVDVVPRNEYDAVVSALDNSTKEFLKLHDAYQKQKSEHEKAIEVIKETHRLAGEVKAEVPLLVKHTKEETAREIFEEIEKLHLHITNEFDARRYVKLKKKYIGE